VEDWQTPTLDDVFKYPRILVMWPATLGKTTMFSIALPLFREIGNPDLEGLGVFKDDDDCKSALKTIKDEASENEKLVADYGPLKPSPSDRTKKWTQHRVDFAQRTRRSKQSSLMFFPYGSAVLGKRSNWRFADDIVLRKIAMSAALNRQQIQWFEVDFETGSYAPQDAASYVLQHDQIIVQMTRMTPEDIGNYLETRVTEDAQRRNPAIRPFHTRVVDLLDVEHERTITPRYTWEQAMAMEAEKPEAFAMRFRNLIITDKTARFKRVYIDGGEYEGVNYPGCWNKDLTRGNDLMPGNLILPGMKVVIGYDPQSGSKTHDSAEAGLVMLGNMANGEWRPRLLDYARGKWEILGDKDPESQIMRILGMARACNKVGVVPNVALEGNNIQRALRRGILEAAQRHSVEVRCTTPYTGVNKWDPETGLEQSVIDFENGWLEIPGMYPTDRAFYKGFVDAMCSYGASAFKDVPIAYWKARQHLFEQRGQNSQKQQVITVTNRTPPRIAYRLKRLGMLDGLVIRDAYATQEVEDGQRIG